MTLALKPNRGGFLRPFGCGIFIREFLAGNSPYGSPAIEPGIGAPQSDICHYYKKALSETTAIDRATRQEEKQARHEKRAIDPDNIQKLIEVYLARMPYKSAGCTYHSFVVYFARLQKLRWVESSGREEPSTFQDNYPPGPPRRYYRLTAAGMNASEAEWANPQEALYPRGLVL